MVSVTVIIFFGKSEKNIWVLDFFNYNLKYRISKTVNQIYSWNSITEQQQSSSLQIYSWNSYHSRTLGTVITAITCNSRADTTAITWNGITVITWNRATGQQQYSYHRLNSIKLFLRYGVTSMAEWEMSRTTRIIRTLCVACKRVKATRPDHLCDECRARHKGWSMWQHYKGSSKSRGYGYAWSKLRLKALERDKHLCQMCLKRGIFTTATDVDHIVPLAQGGSDDMENLQSLCHECHKQKTCQERLNNKNYLHDKT